MNPEHTDRDDTPRDDIPRDDTRSRAEEALVAADPASLLAPLDEPSAAMLARRCTAGPVLATPVRAVPVRRPVRALVAAAALAVPVVSLLGISVLAKPSRPVITLAGDAAVGVAESKLAGPASSSMTMPSLTELVLAPGLDEPGGTGPVWRFVAPTRTDAEGLAARLGITEALVESRLWASARAEARGWSAGPLTVSPEGWWSYSDPALTACTEPAPLPAPAEPVPGGAATKEHPATSSTASAEQDLGAANRLSPATSCARPRPSSLPSDQEATTRARALTDIDGLAATVTVHRDDWSVNVSVSYDVATEGAPSGSSATETASNTALAWGYVSFGDDATVLNASGMLTRLELAGEYDLIDAAAALARVNEESSALYKLATPACHADSPGGAGGTPEPALAVCAEDGPALVAPDTTPAPGLDAPTVQTAPAPAKASLPAAAATTPPVELQAPTRATVTRVSRSYTLLADTAGVSWVVPAWVFHLADGGQITAHALGPDAVRAS
jgi:hypothetical protein